jgi:hypothetical protein
MKPVNWKKVYSFLQAGLSIYKKSLNTKVLEH